VDRNAFLAFALSFLVLSLWMTWEAQNRPKPPPQVPVVEGEAVPGEPAAPGPEATPPQTAAQEPKAPAAAAPAPGDAPADVAAETLRFENPQVRAVLSSRGAGIERWQLLEYTSPPNEGAEPVALIASEAVDAPALATPFPELGLGDLSVAVFEVVERGPRVFAFELARGGLIVRKRIEFEEEGYRGRLRVEVENGTQQALEPSFAVTLTEHVRDDTDLRDLGLVALADGDVERVPLNSFGTPGFVSSMFGGGVELERTFPTAVEWVGADSNYFLAVISPDVSRDAQSTWVALDPGKLAVASLARPAALPPGTTVAREMQIYFGPKEPDRLEAIGAQLERSIQLGWSWIAPVTRAFNKLLTACYEVIPNYGVAIIILTILVRLVTAPLTHKQMESMKRLGTMQPRMKEIQEKYKADRERQSQEMAKLMRETGWNPLGGCLPMLLQFPVMIGLYYALQSSISLRQAPFALWIDDLSRPETLFTIPGLELPVRVLPILMAGSMVLQQKLTPTTSMDPAQQRMMMVMMPLMFGFLFYTFPSGLVLYWFVSNLLAIAQQLWMNRRSQPQPQVAKAKA
jgi:YidC/Oxa1 family membrane protein insertase